MTPAALSRLSRFVALLPVRAARVRTYARACEARPEMSRRFIFVTGDIDGADTIQFLESSRCGFLMKPFNLDRLTTAVDMLVAGHRDEAAG